MFARVSTYQRSPEQMDQGITARKREGQILVEDDTQGRPENDFTNRNTTFMSWNLMHMARMIKDARVIPAYGNQRSMWVAGCRLDQQNPEHR